MLNSSVSKPILNSSRIVPLIGKSVAAGMPQHMDVYGKAKLCFLAYALYKAIEGIRSEGRTSFASEHVCCL
jgi:hypothetical protein